MSSKGTKMHHHHHHEKNAGPHRLPSTIGGCEVTTNSTKCSNVTPDIEQLRVELEREKENRSQIHSEYADLKRQMEEFAAAAEESRKNPTSKYDESISKQSYFNETLTKQVAESKEKLKSLSQSLKHIQACGKDCNIHMGDLIIDYHCISKSDLSKEIKRFQRMQIDLKSNLDRLQWRLDCESKIYHSVFDQYQKLQMDLHYLQNLSDKNPVRDLWL